MRVPYLKPIHWVDYSFDSIEYDFILHILEYTILILSVCNATTHRKTHAASIENVHIIFLLCCNRALLALIIYNMHFQFHTVHTNHPHMYVCTMRAFLRAHSTRTLKLYSAGDNVERAALIYWTHAKQHKTYIHHLVGFSSRSGRLLTLPLTYDIKLPSYFRTHLMLIH